MSNSLVGVVLVGLLRGDPEKMSYLVGGKKIRINEMIDLFPKSLIRKAYRGGATERENITRSVHLICHHSFSLSLFLFSIKNIYSRGNVGRGLCRHIVGLLNKPHRGH